MCIYSIKKRFKRATSLSLVTLFTIFFVACSTVKVAEVKKLEKVAVVSIGTNKWIDMSEFGIASRIVNQLAKDEDFDLKPVVKNMHGRIFGDFGEIFPFHYVEESKVIKSDRYKDFELYSSGLAEKGRKQFHLPAKGYQYLQASQPKKNIQKIFNIVPEETDAIMLVNCSYKLDKKLEMAGFGTAKLKAKLRIYVYKRDGSKIMKFLKTGQSDNSIKFALGGAALDAKEIQPLCKDAVDEALQKSGEFFKKKMAGS